MNVFLPGQRLQFKYRNHRDVIETRDVIFKGLDYGHNDWYPNNQWFMRCYDVARKADRSFALSRMDGKDIEVVPLGLLKAVDALAGPEASVTAGEDSDLAVSIGKDAFDAGYNSAAQRAVDFAPTVVTDWATHREAAWSDYTPPEELCGRTFK